MRIDGIGNWVLLAMAAASLVSMIAAFSVYSIVNNDLYKYGLQFSYGWAISYWNAIGTVFAMAWFSIIAAIAFQVYRIIVIRREEAQIAYEQLQKRLKVRFGEKDGETGRHGS
jgi:protein-S-isoprenylcysteine O-methyltransferase Ste14